MQFKTLRRTTTFRLSMLYGLIFAIGSVALLGMVYYRSVVYLTERIDGILHNEARGLETSPRPSLRERLVEELTLNGEKTNIFALFSDSGDRIAGNLEHLPPGLHIDGDPVEIAPTAGFPEPARLIARKLPDGDILVVGRDAHQLLEMRTIVLSALRWSGALIIFTGLVCGIALSLGPLRRLQELQRAGREVGAGDMSRRMPVSARGDELDMLASTVNGMMDEVERLVSEVKGATEIIAHDLLTPLAQASMQLRGVDTSSPASSDIIARVNIRIDQVLERFRAILRVAELESRDRRSGFGATDLPAVVHQVIELYQPLAEASGVALSAGELQPAITFADSKLLFEALCNLVDNAIKFSGHAGLVRLEVTADAQGPRVSVIDNGPGIPASERHAVLARFYRSRRQASIPGTGLGLNVVAAIVRLHGFQLILEDAGPGLRATIWCQATKNEALQTRGSLQGPTPSG